ncbi:hypothetical protein [Gallibacterium salpingitidis]|uniref:hypothetical protein n=1 Tax=Gallibacterium salpingitidis TaxID=505341 RepID=UPI0012E90F82|nr:hypothetical protein [Gallibacterium salpingitidis]
MLNQHTEITILLNKARSITLILSESLNSPESYAVEAITDYLEQALTLLKKEVNND